MENGTMVVNIRLEIVRSLINVGVDPYKVPEYASSIEKYVISGKIENWKEEVKFLYNKGERVKAVKLYKEKTGIKSNIMAKEKVEELCKEK